MPNPKPAETINLSPETVPRLGQASSASVATLLFKRGYHNAYIQGSLPLNPDVRTMVGPAYTLRYIPTRPDTDPLDAFREPDHPQRVAVEECPEGAVLVMDCRQDASAASAGSILLTRCQIRGVAGVVSDGGIRDAKGAATLDMPVFAAKPSAPTNLTKHHAVDIGMPIACGGVAVYPGDIMMGDADGVMVIPRHLADEIAAETVDMELFEAFVIEQVTAGASIAGLYPPTNPDTVTRYEAWKANQRTAPMRETWRWFGEFDPISLNEVAQTGAVGIVSALHAIPYGEVWPQDAIARRRTEIEAAGLTWDVVESLPVHEDIKRGTGDLSTLFANYRASLANLAREGIKTVCYNFMPILDWTRTDLAAPAPAGGTCLHFSAAKMAALEIHILKRDGAQDDYHPDAIKAGTQWFQDSSEADRAALLDAVMAGLPGAVDRFDVAGLQQVLDSYEGLSHDDLRANLVRFLNEVIPTAAELGINLCIHPDDPPRDILGLPRIVSNEHDIRWIMDAVDQPANGLTLCTGSLGSRPKNDIPAIARAFAHRIHFVHLRNVTKTLDGSFTESAHLEGDVDLVAVIDELLEAESSRGVDLPFRADHGHALLTDSQREFQPGYTLIGRLRGLSELRGIIAALS